MSRHRKPNKNIMFGTTFPPENASDIIEYVDKYYNNNLAKFIRDATIEKYEKVRKYKMENKNEY